MDFVTAEENPQELLFHQKNNFYRENYKNMIIWLVEIVAEAL